MAKRKKFDHSLNVKLIKPYTAQPFWALKVYPYGYGRNGLTIAKCRTKRVRNWILCLYKQLCQCNSDTPLQEVKKHVGKFMTEGFSKRKLPLEKLKRTPHPKNAKPAVVF